MELPQKHKTSTENIRTDTHQGRETGIRSFCDLQNENALCEAGFSTLAEMRELNTNTHE
jgi:hypothetical protein